MVLLSFGKTLYAPVISNHGPTTYGEGWGIARLKCRAVACIVPAVRGKCQGFDIGIFILERFEPHQEKIGFLPWQKQRRSSAVQ